MAQNTPLSYRNLVIYEAFVRNHGPHGTFADVEADLPRIRAMGVDMLWFMPIHPIGQVQRKGSLGSPYSIADYRGINPQYGTRQDFIRLVESAHARGLKIMIDVVYNHTAHDSRLVREHPEYFHQDKNGQPFTTVPAWSDVIDLKHPNPDLTAYLIETLQDWVRLGVDGFRCDVASIVPLDFWQQARTAVAQVKPGITWLAESVSASFVAHRHDQGLPGYADCELYTAFDLTYDYDIWPIWQAAVMGRVPISRYLEMLRFQDCIYPANFVKMRCVENHDQPRIQGFAPGRAQALAWTAFAAFNRGAFLIYGGQEAGAEHRPSLFDRDPVDWRGYPLQPYLTRLAQIKKDPALQAGNFMLLQSPSEAVIQAAWFLPGAHLYGVFNTRAERGPVAVHLPDGTYPDLLSDAKITVRAGNMALPESAVILRSPQPIQIEPFTCDLLDFNSQME